MGRRCGRPLSGHGPSGLSWLPYESPAGDDRQISSEDRRSVKLRVRPPPTDTHQCHRVTPTGGTIMLTVAPMEIRKERGFPQGLGKLRFPHSHKRIPSLSFSIPVSTRSREAGTTIGRGLRGARYGARPPGRAESAAGRYGGQPGTAPAVPTRSQGAGRAQPPQHRHHPRSRGERRAAIPDHGAGRRREPRPVAAGRRPGRGQGVRHRDPDGRCAGRRPRERDRAP